MSKQAVYHAEFNLRDIFTNCNLSRTATVAGVTVTVPDERRFGHLDTVRQYVSWVLADVQHVYPSRPCDVVEGSKALVRKAYHDGGWCGGVPEDQGVSQGDEAV